MEVDMEILRGLENLGAPWGTCSMGLILKKDYTTIGATMILDPSIPRYHPDTECEH